MSPFAAEEIQAEVSSTEEADTTPSSSSRPINEDPFMVWLARQPAAQRPLSAKEKRGLAEAERRLASNAPRRSTEDLLAAARVLRGQ